MDLTPLDNWLATVDGDFWASGQWRCTIEEFIDRMSGGEPITLVDLREPQEVTLVALPFALHIPLPQLPQRWQEVPRDHPVVTFCSGDLRATMAFTYLRTRGFDNVRILAGGYSGLVSSLSLANVKRMTEGK